jgi:hypothetical protein
LTGIMKQHSLADLTSHLHSVYRPGPSPFTFSEALQKSHSTNGGTVNRLCAHTAWSTGIVPMQSMTGPELRDGQQSAILKHVHWREHTHTSEGKLIDRPWFKLLDEWQNSFTIFQYTLHHSPPLATTKWRRDIHSSKMRWSNNFSRFSIKSVHAEKSSSPES